MRKKILTYDNFVHLNHLDNFFADYNVHKVEYIHLSDIATQQDDYNFVIVVG